MHGVIAAGDAQTAEAGAALLRAGGNAVDAAVAAAFATFVVEPPLSSPGGGGIAIVAGAGGARVHDFFATVPGLGITRGELDFFGAEVDFGPTTQVFHIGRGSVAVPSALFGLLGLHERSGSVPLRAVLEPAIDYARNGFTLSQAIFWVHTLLAPILTHDASVRALLCDGDALAPAGSRLSNPDLADFLDQLAVEGEALLRGDFAALVARHYGPEAGGLLTRADVAAYQPVIREPLAVPFGDATVLTNPPPGSGGALVGLGLRIADGLDLGQHAFLGPTHPRRVAQLLGTVSEARRSGFDERVREPGGVDALLGDVAAARWRERAIARTEKALGGTTHISVVDSTRTAAAITLSNGEGCGTLLPGTGIHLNNFLGEDDINPHGFHTMPAGARMTTMMAPTAVVRDGRVAMCLGSGGSNRIRSAILQGLLNTQVFGQAPEDAANAPRIHVEGDKCWFEAWNLHPDAVTGLEADWPDHARFDAPNMFFGGIHIAAIVGRGFAGGGDHRRGGAVVTF